MNYKTLNIFDFDNTLVDSPRPEHGMTAYEAMTGIPWVIKDDETALKYGFKKGMRRTGWWGRPETLSPPLMPRPAPPSFRIEKVYQEYLKAKADPDALNVMMTGRHVPFEKTVIGILNELGMDFDKYLFKGSKELTSVPGYPNDADTAGYKAFAVREVLLKPGIRNLKIWDDRADFIEEFQTSLVPGLPERFPDLEYVGIFDVLQDKAYHYPLKAGNLRLGLRK
jgi:hypothetical protein